jgi:hypothetical protein
MCYLDFQNVLLIAENFENEHEMLVFVYRTTLDPKIISI